ncbi:DUF6266 family protein [Epilithonimonas hispanica]|uniref:Uncharacterized protein n=2 Tax=Epilithonimonas hispanica TaxID=358687 RepID=A0A3D9CW99_9FLAO|nr:hypothetical protein DRF58_10895 [Epilithonimonas hispanica]
MSKLDDSLLSGSRGRTGRLVVANVNGIEVLKIRPKKSGKQSSLKQDLVKKRMKDTYTFMGAYKAFASQFFGHHFGMTSQFNQAMANLLLAFKLDYLQNQINISYNEIQFAKGNLLEPIPTAIASPVAQQLSLEWYNNSAGNLDRESDLAQILCAIEGEANTIFFQTQIKRSETETTLTLPPNASGKEVHVYIAFCDNLLTQVSNSVYVGSVTLL